MKRMMMFSGALALVALALVAYLALDKPAPKTPEEAWQPGPLLSDGLKLLSVSVTSEGKTVSLVYKPELDAYIIVYQGKEYLADNIMTERLLNTVKTLKREKLIDLDPPDPTIYGLNPPLMNLAIQFEAGEGLELEIGKENYTQDACFARVKGDPTVFLVPLDINAFYGVDLASLRSRSLILTTPMNVASLEIKVYDPAMLNRMEGALLPKLVVQKQTAQRPEWMIVSPIMEPAQFQKINKFFQRLNLVEVKEIIDVTPEDLPKYGLDRPQAALILTLLSGHQQKILFGREEEGWVYVMNSDRKDIMLIPQMTMIDLLLFSGRRESSMTDPREIIPSRVLVEYPRSGMPTMQLDLLPDGRTFSVNGKAEPNVRLARVKKLIKPLRHFEAVFVYHQEPYPREKYGLDRPWMHVQVIEGDTIPLDIALGDTVSNGEVVFTYIEDRKSVV